MKIQLGEVIQDQVCTIEYFLHPEGGERGMVIVFPGGLGTLDELSEVLTLVQTGKINMIPIIFVGKEFWGGLVEWFKKSLADEGMISPGDMDLFKVVDTAEETVAYLQDCHRYSKRSSVK